MKIFNPIVITIVLTTVFSFFAFSQEKTLFFDTDSLLNKLSENKFINRTFERAKDIYTLADVHSENILLTAFKIAYLEKVMLDSGLITIPKSTRKLYKKTNILTIVDFTKTADKRRFLTIDLVNNRVLFDTLVSHGSAKDKNSVEEVPKYFGNTDKSNKSSLGLIVTRGGTQPKNPGHFCKFSLSHPHDCSLFLAGMEKDVNHLVADRAIVMHTTGSKNFGDSASQLQLKNISREYVMDTAYRVDEKRLLCFSSFSKKEGTPIYAAEKYIASHGNFIGRSLGCLVLPEESHREIIETIKNGSLIFAYSNIITEGSTNYFVESPIIKQIIAFAAKDSVITSTTNNLNLVK